MVVFDIALCLIDIYVSSPLSSTYLLMTVQPGVSTHTATHSGLARAGVHAGDRHTHVHRAVGALEPRSTDAPPSHTCPVVETGQVETLVSFAHVSRERRGACAHRLSVVDVARAPVQTRRLVVVTHVI